MLHRNVRFDGSSTVDASATPAAPAATATERLAAAAATTWSWSASPAARPVPPSRAPGPDLEVCYGARHRSKTAAAFVDAFAPDVTVTAAGNGARGIVRADESLALDVFGRGARALFARGSSYVTIELDRATDVELGSAAGVASVVPRGAAGALAAKVHPWSGRARLVRALVHNGTPLYASPRATLSETLAVLHHCHVAHAAGGAGGAVVVSVCETLELAVPHAGAPNEQTLRLVARGVEVRCPEASWRPWMPLALRFSSDRVQIQRTRRTAAPIPPVVELTARGARDRLALEDMAEFLHSRGEVGRAPTEGCGANLPACDVFVMPRNRAIEWLEDFVAIEKRHTTMTPEEADVAALRRMAKLPPRGDPDMDTRTLWGVVVPPDESSARPSDGGALDAAPAEQLRHVAALTRAIGAGLRTS